MAMIGYSIAGITCGILLWIVIMRIHAHHLTTKHYIFVNQKIKTDCKICFISDFHYQHFLADGYYQKVVDQVNKQNPDIVIFGGDYLHRNVLPNKEDANYFIQLLANIQAPKKIAILGNHDKDNFSDGVWYEIFSRHQIQLLINEALELSTYGVNFIGVDDFKKGNVEIKRSDLNESFQLLLTHNPDLMEHIDKHAFELVLSGHLHGGQGTFGFGLYPALRAFKLSDYGKKYRHGNVGSERHAHISTSGVGAHFGLRFFVYPEVVCIHLKSTQ